MTEKQQIIITEKTQNNRKAETKRAQNENFIVVATVARLGIFNCSLNLYFENSLAAQYFVLFSVLW